MTERFPEQRNRSAQRRADADQVSEALPVLDESFIAAAPVREPSAHARALLARRLLDLPDSQLRLPRGGPDQPRWSVRPSHHLAAIRFTAVLSLTCVAAAAAALLFILLR